MKLEINAKKSAWALFLISTLFLQIGSFGFADITKAFGESQCQAIIMIRNDPDPQDPDQIIKIQIMLPLSVKERISYYGHWSQFSVDNGDIAYLLPSESRSTELQKILSEYGYASTSQNQNLINDMGTPEDILLYFKNIWDAKSRSEKNSMRHQWKDYWNQFFPEYTTNMYNILGFLLSPSGYSLNLREPDYTCTMVTPNISISSRASDGRIDIGHLQLDGTSHSFPNTVSISIGVHTLQAFYPHGYEFDHWELSGGISLESGTHSSTVITIRVTGDGSITSVLRGQLGQTDLVVSSISWTPSNPLVGDNVDFTFTICNQGSSDAIVYQNALFIDGAFKDVSGGISSRVGNCDSDRVSFRWTATSGSHNIKVVADHYRKISESNESNNEKVVTLNVETPISFDFSISSSPSSVSIIAGETASSAIYVQLLSGSAQSVTLSCSGIPSSQASCRLNGSTSSIIVTPTTSATLTIETGTTAIPNAYTATITATGGGLTKSATFSVTVESPLSSVVLTSPWSYYDADQLSETAPFAVVNTASALATATKFSTYLHAYSVAWVGGAGAMGSTKHGSEYTAPVSGEYQIEYEYDVDGTASIYGSSPGVIVTAIAGAFESALIKILGSELAKQLGVRNAGVNAKLLFVFGDRSQVEEIYSQDDWISIITWKDTEIKKTVIRSFTINLVEGHTYDFFASLTGWTANGAAAVQASGSLIKLSGSLIRVCIQPPGTNLACAPAQQRTLAFLQNPPEAASISLLGSAFKHGDTIGNVEKGNYQISATTQGSDIRFFKWVPEGGVTIRNAFGNPTTMSIEGSGRLSADFEAKINFLTEPLNAGKISYDGSEFVSGQFTWEKSLLPAYGTIKTLKALVPTGYKFVEWKVSNNKILVLSPNNIETGVTVAGYGSITAVFEKSEPSSAIPTILTLDGLPNEVLEGERIVFSGRLATVNGEGVPRTVLYIIDDDPFRQYPDIITSITTDENGYFNANWVVHPTDWYDRTVEVYGTFVGDNLYKSSRHPEKNHLTIKVTKKIPIISDFQTPTDLFKLGDTLNFGFKLKNLIAADTFTVSLNLEGPNGEHKDFGKFEIYKKNIFLTTNELKQLAVSWDIPRNSQAGTYAVNLEIFDSTGQLLDSKVGLFMIDTGETYVEAGSSENIALMHIHLNQKALNEIGLTQINNPAMNSEKLVAFLEKVPELNSGDLGKLIKSFTKTAYIPIYYSSEDGGGVTIVYYPDGRLEYYSAPIIRTYDEALAKEINELGSAITKIIFGKALKAFIEYNLKTIAKILQYGPSGLKIPETLYITVSAQSSSAHIFDGFNRDEASPWFELEGYGEFQGQKFKGTGTVEIMSNELSIKTDSYWYNVYAIHTFDPVPDFEASMKVKMMPDSAPSTNFQVELGSYSGLSEFNQPQFVKDRVNLAYDGFYNRWIVGSTDGQSYNVATTKIPRDTWIELKIKRTGNTWEFYANNQLITVMQITFLQSVNFIDLANGVGVHWEGGTHVHYDDVILSEVGARTPAPSDSDGDGIPNEHDQCRDLPETFNGYLDEDGCADTPLQPDLDRDPPEHDYPDVELSWTHVTPSARPTVLFDLLFRDNNGSTREHIDYRLGILKEGEELFSTTSHTHSGKDTVAYEFDAAGKYVVMVTVTGLNFEIVEPRSLDFPFLAEASVTTPDEGGMITFSPSTGSLASPTTVPEESLPADGKPAGMSFPFGLFKYTIADIAPGSAVTVTMVFPSDIPAESQYWKFQNGQYLQMPPELVGDNDDGDNVLTLTLTDGGIGDADGSANGIIDDPGGPAFVSVTGGSGGGHGKNEFRGRGFAFGDPNSPNYDSKSPAFGEVLTLLGSLKVFAEIHDNVGVNDANLVVDKAAYPMERYNGDPSWWVGIIPSTDLSPSDETVLFKIIASDYNNNIAEHSGSAKVPANAFSTSSKEGASFAITSALGHQPEPGYSIIATGVEPGGPTVSPQITIKNTGTEPLQNIRLMLSPELRGKFLLSEYAIRSIIPETELTVSLIRIGKPNVDEMGLPIPYKGQIIISVNNHTPYLLDLSGEIPNDSAMLQSLIMKMIASKAEQRYKNFEMEKPSQRISDVKYEATLGSGESAIKSASDQLIIKNTGDKPLKNLRIMTSSLSDHFLLDQKNIALLPAGDAVTVKLISKLGNSTELAMDLSGELLIFPENGEPVTIPINIRKTLQEDSLGYEVRTVSGRDAISNTADGIVIKNNGEEPMDNVRLILPRELARVFSLSDESLTAIEPHSEKAVHLRLRGTLDSKVKEILNDYRGEIIVVGSQGVKRTVHVNIVWKSIESDHFVIYARDNAEELTKAVAVINFLERGLPEVMKTTGETKTKGVIYMTSSLDELKMLSDALAPSTFVYEGVGFVWSSSEDMNMLALRQSAYRTIMQNYATYWTEQKISMDRGNWLVDGISNYVTARIVGERGMIKDQLNSFIEKPESFEWYGPAAPSQYGAAYTLFKFLVDKYGDSIIDKALHYLGSGMISNHRCDTFEQCVLLRAVYDANGLNINDKKHDLSFATILEQWVDYVNEKYLSAKMDQVSD